VAGAFGPGANGPLVVAVDTDADVAGLASSMRATPGVASVLPLPTSRQLVHRLRHDVVPERVDVGGAAARSVDERELLGRWFPWLIGAVVGLSFVLLLALFRSVLAALGAVVAHVLAVAAACGVMALAVQGGWWGRLVGITAPTPIPAWVPLTVLALLSGWSLAAEVTRMVAAPAAAVVAVGASFLLADRVEIKVFALGLAVAVLLDATLVRMVLPRLDVEPREPPAAPAPPTAIADEDDDEWELVGV
jgi:RND superfamily putative drug exporter